MRNERIKAATAIRDDLLPAEEAIDVSLARLGRLAATMCTARIEANLAACHGQVATAHVTRAIALLGEARGHIVAAHADLGEARKFILPNVVSWGDDLPKAPAIEPAQLRAVA